MYADVTPNVAEIGPGESCTVTVRVSNSSPLIDAYSVQVFGVDPQWVTVSPPRLSLFPDESGTVEVTIQLPVSFPAGHRQLSVNVSSENDPEQFTLSSLGLMALGHHRLRMRLDPITVTGASEAVFGLIVTNDGNTTVTAVASAMDQEELTGTIISPEVIELLPGQQETLEATVSGPRPWFGQPKVRVINFAVESTSRIETIGTFVQRPRISRWMLSLMGLRAAAAVFAAILSRTFSTVVDEAAIDKNLINEALDKGGGGGVMVPVDPGSVTGKVVLFSTGDGVGGVQAELFKAGDTRVPVATSATNDDGSYVFSRLGTGTFKVRFSGAGFNAVWYES
ncbi:MAG TPA: carboxypeptidase regulatory-like domain-containing protein, partial [Ilumatobacteraceae bacterium]|nr:carboxypeptidase regulatory-like domain-containing protein [Ilumatobacteraceae bacterium]